MNFVKTAVLGAAVATAFAPVEETSFNHGAILRGAKQATVQMIGGEGEGVQYLDTTLRVGVPAEEVARNAIAEHVGKIELQLKDKYTTKHLGVTHMYFKQIVNGLEVANSDVNVNVNAQGQVLSIGSSAIDTTGLRMRKPEAVSTPLEAVTAFVQQSNIFAGELRVARQSSKRVDGQDVTSMTFENDSFSEAIGMPTQTVDAKLVYMRNADNKLELTWQFAIQTESPRFAIYQAAMSADAQPTPVVVQDLVKWEREPVEEKKDFNTRYRAYGPPATDPRLGDRIVDESVKEGSNASPQGWQNNLRSDSTIGNNADSYFGNGRYRATAADKNFDFPIDFNQEPATYRDAAITNLQYWNNLIHDLFFEAGFDEESGNFQTENFSGRGRGNDAVLASAQDGGGYNNANFATPPDGSPGQMRMYLWNQVSPMLDGDLDSGIVIHEYGHGISTRLTGGPSNSGCLGGGEGGGMGEGWGDTWATMLSIDRTMNGAGPYPMGEYAAGRGIRPFPYSTDRSVNPQTYSLVGQGSYTGVHAIGSVWATTLMDAFWGLVDVAGFDDDWVNGTGGNNVLFQLIVDGLKLQPCSPTMVQARDAILLAETANFGGRYKCTLWEAFAGRGIGVNAVPSEWLLGLFPISPAVDNFDVPRECQ